MEAKSEAAEAIKRIQARAEVECGKKIGVLHIDRGREFTSASFGKYCDELSMQRHLAAPYSPPAERSGGTPKSDHRWDSKVLIDDGRDARTILGRGGNDGRLPPQSVANAKPRQEDATRGLVQQEANGTSSSSVRLRRIHEGHASPPRQAQSQGAEGRLHRLRSRKQGVQVL